VVTRLVSIVEWFYCSFVDILTSSCHKKEQQWTEDAALPCVLGLASCMFFSDVSDAILFIMAALHSRCGHYIFAL